ncbi:MAG: hypothetical protein KIH69_014545 [Anaerolineae bacterium]|nr:hypothetical protein [Anaerolineae bacterium]
MREIKSHARHYVNDGHGDGPSGRRRYQWIAVVPTASPWPFGADGVEKSHARHYVNDGHDDGPSGRRRYWATALFGAT